MYVCVCEFVHIMCVYMYVCEYVYVFVCEYVYMFMCGNVCVYVCECVTE